MKKYLVAASAWLLPAFAFANTINTSGINNSIRALTGTINLIVPLLLAVAVVVFIYGVIRYIIAKGPQESKDARNYIIWGIIGIAVILAVWGLARLLISAFGLSPTALNANLLPLVPSTSVNESF